MFAHRYFVGILIFVGIFCVPLSAQADPPPVTDFLNISAQVGSGTTTTTGGGGGGGGGGYSSPTSITFTGRAYPLSRVTVLMDGAIMITTIAGPDARFTTTLQNLSSGNHTFSVYSEDSNGNRSTLFTFPLFITSGATTDVSGIFIAPTIDVDKSEVKLGDNINIFGVSAPSSTITISVHSPVERFVQTGTDSNGVYLYTYDTSPLELGSHDTKSKAIDSGTASEYGNIVSFLVGNKNVKKDQICGTRGDLNNDCKVNLVDFSIMAFWYKKNNPPTKVDLSSDHKVTIVDFSILAYYWTG